MKTLIGNLYVNFSEVVKCLISACAYPFTEQLKCFAIISLHVHNATTAKPHLSKFNQVL